MPLAEQVQAGSLMLRLPPGLVFVGSHGTGQLGHGDNPYIQEFRGI